MVVVKDEETNGILPNTNAPDENVEVRAETEYCDQNIEFTISGSGLLCETTSLLVRKHRGFYGSSQKNTLSTISVLQAKAPHFHYFILKVPCLY